MRSIAKSRRAELVPKRSGIINIERESKLSGNTYDKGVLILGGYLGGQYAQNSPLSLSSTVCFEQSYDGVDGDSASSTELYAILSSLSEIPIRQAIAVTGSVNQNGDVQAIGGVNQKIEGYYDVCRLKGLTGEQGVLIPQSNLRNLMLRSDVVEAVKDGKFHIYAVGTVDEGIEVLTGRPAGRRNADGNDPAGSINDLVQKKSFSSSPCSSAVLASTTAIRLHKVKRIGFIPRAHWWIRVSSPGEWRAEALCRGAGSKRARLCPLPGRRLRGPRRAGFRLGCR